MTAGSTAGCQTRETSSARGRVTVLARSTRSIPSMSISTSAIRTWPGSWVRRSLDAGKPGAQKWPVFMGLLNEKGYPHQGPARLRSISLTPTTGTLLMRGIFPNPDGKMLPGIYARVRVPVRRGRLSWCPRRRSDMTSAARSCSWTNSRNVVERRASRPALLCGHDAGRRRRSHRKGLGRGEGLQKAIPGTSGDPGEAVRTLPPVQPESRAPEAPMISRFFIERPILANVLAVHHRHHRVSSATCACRWSSIPRSRRPPFR